MVGQAFANPCPFPFSDTTLHRTQPEKAKGSPGSSEEDQMALSWSHLPTDSHFSELTQPGSGWTQGTKGEWGLILAVKEAASEVGSREKDFLCYHVTGCTLWQEEQQSRGTKSHTEINTGPGGCRGSGVFLRLARSWVMNRCEPQEQNKPTSQLTATRPIKRRKVLWFGFREQLQTDLSSLYTR